MRLPANAHAIDHQHRFPAHRSTLIRDHHLVRPLILRLHTFNVQHGQRCTGNLAPSLFPLIRNPLPGGPRRKLHRLPDSGSRRHRGHALQLRHRIPNLHTHPAAAHHRSATAHLHRIQPARINPNSTERIRCKGRTRNRLSVATPLIPIDRPCRTARTRRSGRTRRTHAQRQAARHSHIQIPRSTHHKLRSHRRSRDPQHAHSHHAAHDLPALVAHFHRVLALRRSACFRQHQHAPTRTSNLRSIARPPIPQRTRSLRLYRQYRLSAQSHHLCQWTRFQYPRHFVLHLHLRRCAVHKHAARTHPHPVFTNCRCPRRRHTQCRPSRIRNLHTVPAPLIPECRCTRRLHR